MTSTHTIQHNSVLHRVRRFFQKSRLDKFRSFHARWVRIFPKTPVPIRLPSDAWWLFDRDFIGESLLEGGYEMAESSLAGNFLKPGMTVVDIGAHRGFHTLSFSKKVGKRGRVVSIEPSPSDQRRLRLHLRINFCRNVEVIQCALGEEDGTADLYTVPTNSVLNSLRPPDTTFETSTTSVNVRKLDDVLSRAKVETVDFVKLDVEGGELGVLKGARQLLERVPRPVILCEVLEIRTRPWGYPGRLIIEYLAERGFSWFELNSDGTILPLEDTRSEFNGNFVAVPEESLSVVAGLTKTNSGGVPNAGI
jgi:FkbM family methyltransferase